ncbi:dipeptidase [Sphingosinicella xenopeptidilytica]|uniref:Dipeptidase n=1 Tax=Sphingosinicella xenopeptidilytica TaxID=364098 RepID=A0ABW3C653_SPHXN
MKSDDHGWTRRRALQSLAAAGTVFPATGRASSTTLSPDQIEAGRAFLRDHVSVDVHAHPGRFFLRGVTMPSPRLQAYGAPFEIEAAAAMRDGQVSCGFFSGVADMSLLEFTPERGLHATRDFQPGEAWADYTRQIGTLKALVASGGTVDGRSVRSIAEAHERRAVAATFAIEGGDFIEDRLDRVAQAYADGVRSITIVHYHVNQIGDIQTETDVHGGLTPLGRDIVREMNRTGIIVDVAHATLAVTRDVAAITERPLLLSHSNVTARNAPPHPRLVTPDHARIVAETGGVIGSVPSGINQSSFEDWIESILRLVDTVGIDHVAIGTDMDANYRPVFTDYRQWPLIPAALLARGMSAVETAKVMGGNALRLMEAQTAERGKR